MKKLTRLMALAALATGLVAQTASAVLVTNTVRNIQAANVRVTLAAGTGVASGETYSAVNGAIRNQYTLALGGQTGKAWIQFDLSNTWAFYGQTNLTSATLALWNQNGTSRQFWVAGVADSAGLEGWTQPALTWSNAPANNYFTLATMGYAFDYTKCFGGTNIWEVNSGTQGIDVSVPANSQGAVYYSTNASSKVYQFLTNDADGKVTMAISDGPGNSNQTIPIGTNGVYAGQAIAPNGIVTKDSPTLILVFNVRVAITGGGLACSGGSGVNVSMAGTDAGVNYFLFTNGVDAGVMISGTGSAVSFGSFNTPGTYTAISSNLTTTVTNAVAGFASVGLVAAPVITNQPASFVAATNSIAVYSVAATGLAVNYHWYHNGVALTDDGHYSGTTSSQLVINPVLASDAATTANGYYCLVANSCGDTVISKTNALTIQTARNLVWQGTPTNAWDIATSTNWLNTGSASVDIFNQGDNVTLDGTASNPALILSSPFLSPGTITFNSGGVMTIGGSGSISGTTSSLLVNGPTLSSELIISNANSFAGGTTINDGWLVMRNVSSVGSGTITMAGTGFSLLEVVPAGGANSGIPGLNVTTNSTLQFDGGAAFAGVIVGPLTGTTGTTLTIHGTAIATGGNFRVYNTNFTCNCNLALNFNGGGNFAPYNSSGTQIYNGVISGNGTLFTRNGGGNVILNGANTYAGGNLLSLGTIGIGIDSAGDLSSGPLSTGSVVIDTTSGNVGLFASGGAHTVLNPLTYSSTVQTINLIFNGSNQLTWGGVFDLSASGATTGTNRTLQVDNTAPTILSGVISDQGLACGIIKTGNGALYLNNAGNTYTGTNTVSAGLLAGAGTIAGPVVVGTSGVLGGGSAAAIGTLTINNSLTLNGGAFIRVNKSLSPGQSNDVVSVSGTLVNSGTGTVTVTNLGSALQVGDKFILFSQPVVTGNTMSVTGAGATWTNNLAVDGSIAVLSTSSLANYSTNISFSVAGNTLTISWPSTHLGWILQSQTNSLSVGLKTNWVDVAGSASITSTNITINPATPTAFYRLHHP